MDNRMIVYIDPEENNLAGRDDVLRALDEIFTDNGYESLVFDGKT